MAFPQGLNFRTSSGYVTDGANEAFDNGNTGGGASYPRTTPQGNTVGSEGVAFLNVDRNAGLDRRLAGVIYTATNGHRFRIDLPAAGTYNVRSAAGDASFGNPTQWSLRDTTTSLGNLATGSITAGNYKDANDVTYSAANWPANNTARSFTFATTICRIQSEVTSGNTVLAHFYIEAAGGGGTDGAGSAAGTSTVAGVGAYAIASPASAAGTSSVSGAGASQAAADGSASGSSVAAGVGAYALSGVGSASGTSTASAVGQTGGTTSDGVGSASGTSTASAVGQATHAGVGGAAGVSAVSGAGASLFAGTGSADGTSTVTGAAPTVAQGTGSASGTSTANGVSPSAQAYEEIVYAPARQRKPKQDREKRLGGQYVQLDAPAPQAAPEALPAVSKPVAPAKLEAEAKRLDVLEQQVAAQLEQNRADEQAYQAIQAEMDQLQQQRDSLQTLIAYEALMRRIDEEEVLMLLLA